MFLVVCPVLDELWGPCAETGSTDQGRGRRRDLSAGTSSNEPARMMPRPTRTTRLGSVGAVGVLPVVTGGVTLGLPVAPPTTPVGLGSGVTTVDGPGVPTDEGWAEGEAGAVIVRFTKFVRHACSAAAGGRQTV